MTLKEIGERIGLTRERVRQIEHEALNKLREVMEGGGDPLPAAGAAARAREEGLVTAGPSVQSWNGPPPPGGGPLRLR